LAKLNNRYVPNSLPSFRRGNDDLELVGRLFWIVCARALRAGRNEEAAMAKEPGRLCVRKAARVTARAKGSAHRPALGLTHDLPYR
jgi:hypothetical protein